MSRKVSKAFFIEKEDTIVNVQSDSNEKGNALPIGTKLHEFRIDLVIDEGRFSIVYLAADLQLHRTVALREYIPTNLAKRSADQSVNWSSERHKRTFQLVSIASSTNRAALGREICLFQGISGDVGYEHATGLELGAGTQPLRYVLFFN